MSGEAARARFNERCTTIGKAVQTTMMTTLAQDCRPSDTLACFAVAMRLAMSTYLTAYHQPTDAEMNIPEEGRVRALAALRSLARRDLERLRLLVESANPFVTAESLELGLELAMIDTRDKTITNMGPMVKT